VCWFFVVTNDNPWVWTAPLAKLWHTHIPKCHPKLLTTSFLHRNLLPTGPGLMIHPSYLDFTQIPLQKNKWQQPDLDI
jgi:hypothetical protein